MDKPSQEDFETTRKVLEFMLEHIKEHESYAVACISNLEEVLLENSFEVSDYE